MKGANLPWMTVAQRPDQECASTMQSRTMRTSLVRAPLVSSRLRRAVTDWIRIAVVRWERPA